VHSSDGKHAHRRREPRACWHTVGKVVTTAPPPLSIAAVQSAYGRLPLSFEVNHGQADPRVQLFTHGRRHTLFLTPSEEVLALRNCFYHLARGR
jgi:hypothetical protein